MKKKFLVGWFFVLLATAKLLVSASAESSLEVGTTNNLAAALRGQSVITLTGNGRIVGSSIALGDLTNNGKDEIIVGDSVGNVHAYDSNGNQLWMYKTGTMGIEGKAAIGDINQDGWNEVVIGAGSPFTPGNHGGLYVLSHTGNLICSFTTGDFTGDGWRDGVYSSPALADLDKNDGGKLEIIFGSWDAHVYVLKHDCSLVWKKYMRDTIWSSPAVGDINGDGYLDIVIGVDSHDEPDLQPRIYKGGRLEVLDRFGNALSGFPKHIDEVIFSSPALGDITGDGSLEIIVGTGNFWGDPACGHPQGCTPGVGRYVSAWDSQGNPLPGWPRPTNDYVWASPALADLDGDGSLEVIVNSQDGSLYAWKANGSNVPGWPVKPVTPAGCDGTVSFATIASPVVADLNGDGSLEVLLASNWEIVIWDRNGIQQTRTKACPNNGLDLSTNYSLGSSPTVGDIDKDGNIEVLIGSVANSSGSPGAIYIWKFSGKATEDTMPWPAFRRVATNYGLFPLSPQLSADLSTSFLFHEKGSAVNPVTTLQIKNSGGGEFTWAATANSLLVSFAKDTGTAGSTSVTTQVYINASTLDIGQHTFQITVSGSKDSIAVANSPTNLSTTVLVVNKVHRVFLPMTLR